MIAEPRDLSADIAPEITEGRLARQWASVERRLPGFQARRFSLLRVAPIVVPALCLVVWIGASQRERARLSGAVIESADAPFTVQLQDGSSIELAAQSQLRVLRDQPSGVKVEIGAGRVSFDVKHVEKRSFEVVAGVVSLRVVGTQFHVVKAARREGTEIEVAVKRGVVEVQRSDRNAGVRRLSAGEAWSVWMAAQPVPPLPPPPVAAKAQPVAATDEAEAAEPEFDLDERDEIAVSDEPDPEPAVKGNGRASLEGVHAVFARANIARRAGRMADAAQAYAEVLKRFPHDSRAGVSAFELGRIRMDALSDSKGAARAFADALRSSTKAGFREDALARLAIAADATGDREGCRRARASYAAEYASGVHEASLAGLCGGASK